LAINCFLAQSVVAGRSFLQVRDAVFEDPFGEMPTYAVTAGGVWPNT
jgi:hypothetical protein